MKRTTKYILFALAVIIVYLLIFRDIWKRKDEEVSHPRSYDEIRTSGILRAVTEYNSIGYFVDKDTLSGFYYELIHAFAQHKGFKLELTPAMSFDQQLDGLSKGTFDVVANGLALTNTLKDTILLTHPITRSKQILVQRKAESENDSLFIRNQLELAGKTIHIASNSPAIIRIHNLSDEIGETIHLQEVDKYGQEQLVSLVAHHDIDYAICDENIAYALSDSFPTLDFKTPISFTQFYAWGVSKQSVELVDTLNTWIDEFIQTSTFHQIYHRYFK